MPTIDLPDDEFAAVTAAIRRAIEDDKFPHAPRLDPLRAGPGAARGGGPNQIGKICGFESGDPAASQSR
jgi:hypothetical protein